MYTCKKKRHTCQHPELSGVVPHPSDGFVFDVVFRIVDPRRFDIGSEGCGYYFILFSVANTKQLQHGSAQLNIILKQIEST